MVGFAGVMIIVTGNATPLTVRVTPGEVTFASDAVMTEVPPATPVAKPPDGPAVIVATVVVAEAQVASAVTSAVVPPG